MYSKYLKPSLDYSLAGLSLLVVSPLFLVITVLLIINNRGSAFFIQKRPGKDGKIFHIIKFKTMNDKKCENGILLSDYERLTLVGKAVRKTSLDEIPQLINVLKGDMAIIGPRPLLPQYLPLYNEVQKHRHDVRPGITGWAQVNGRNAISWTKKFELDVWYVDNLSFTTDINVFFTTFKKVFKSEGISQEGQVTAEAFNGRN